MAKFDVFRSLVSNFNSEIGAIATERNEKTAEIQRTFLPGVQAEKIANLEKRLAEKERALRGEFLHLLKTEVDAMQASEQGKITPQINLELLNELNILASAGIPLTRDEISTYAEKSMLSGSSICCRKIQKIAADSGFSLRIPDEAAATSVLNETAERLNTFIRLFDGSIGMSDWETVDQRQIKMMASGAFLDGLEAQFESCTVADLALDLPQDGAQQEKNALLTLNYEIEEQTGESKAAQFAKDYSRSQQA